MTVAIIGAGASGLVAAKEAAEAGFVPIIFERGTSLGGLWGPEGRVWKSLMTNLTIHSCCFSDFPWEGEPPLYARVDEMGDYLRKYAAHFNIEKDIHFGAEVLHTSSEEGGWQISYRQAGVEHTVHSSYLVVASGFFEAPAESLKDEGALHSSEYGRAGSYQSLAVVVIGGSFSGCEIAADLARTAGKVHLVMRTPHWVLPRMILSNIDGNSVELPLDFAFYRRSTRKDSHEILSRTPEGNAALHRYFASLVPSLGETPPELPPKVAISDEFWPAVKLGKIEVTRSEEGLHPDVIIEATGYETSVSFLDDAVKKAIGYDSKDQWMPFLLYKGTLTPVIPNLAFIGMYRGPYFAVMELQARLAMAAFQGTFHWERGVEEERILREQKPRAQFPHGDYVGFADDIARCINVCPIWNAVNSQYGQVIADQVEKGPVVPAHYRLIGPGMNPTAALPAIQAVNASFDAFIAKQKDIA